eukprot:SAG31_NODE_222_length_19895_cov_34.907626_9_plen_603_part_00
MGGLLVLVQPLDIVYRRPAARIASRELLVSGAMMTAAARADRGLLVLLLLGAEIRSSAALLVHQPSPAAKNLSVNVTCCVPWPIPNNQTQLGCEVGGDARHDGGTYHWNTGRGTPAAICGERASCQCCRIGPKSRRAAVCRAPSPQPPPAGVVAEIQYKSQIWRDGDPADGVCAPARCQGIDVSKYPSISQIFLKISINISNFSQNICLPARCQGARCEQDVNGCYCSCGYSMFWTPQLAVTKAGTLLSVVEGRKHKWDEGDIGSAQGGKAWHDILLKRSWDSGRSWSNATVVYSESAGWGTAAGDANSSIGNLEVVVDDVTGEIFVFMCRNNSNVLLTSSRDDARTFSAPKDVSAQVKPASLHWGWYATTFSSLQMVHHPKYKGRLVACADHVVGQWTAYPITNGHSHTIISDTHGKTWRTGRKPLALPSSNECSIAEIANGTIVMNSRNYLDAKDGMQQPCKPPCKVHRYISHSYDGGESFEVGWFAQDLPDPIVFSDMTATADGRTLLLTHPPSETVRRNVSLFASRDGGASWSLVAQLEHGPSQYNSITMLPNGTAAIQVDSGCQSNHNPNSRLCDKSTPTVEDFFLVSLNITGSDVP